MLQQHRLSCFPSGQRTRSLRQSVVKMNMRILAAEILNIRRVCRIAFRLRMACRGLSQRYKPRNQKQFAKQNCKMGKKFIPVFKN